MESQTGRVKILWICNGRNYTAGNGDPLLRPGKKQDSQSDGYGEDRSRNNVALCQCVITIVNNFFALFASIPLINRPYAGSVLDWEKAPGKETNIWPNCIFCRLETRALP